MNNNKLDTVEAWIVNRDIFVGTMLQAKADGMSENQRRDVMADMTESYVAQFGEDQADVFLQFVSQSLLPGLS